MGAVKNAFLYETGPVACRECHGEGLIWNNADPTSGQSVDCEHCEGSGECECEDCMSDAAEAAHERMIDGEPPLSADERYQMAARQKQELRR